MLFQIVGDSANGHPIDARATFVRLHPPQCSLQVFPLTYFLHQSIRAGWAFGIIRRRGQFGLFPSRFASFTRWRGREVQFGLSVPLHVAPETHVLLASLLVRAFRHRSRFGLSVDSTFRLRSASLALPTAWPTMPSADFCPAIRLPLDSLSPLRTQDRSPGVISAAFREQPPDLRFAPLMDTDFAVSCPLVRRWRLISGVCPSTRTFATRFLQTPPRGGSPCVLASPSPPSGWAEDSHLQTAEHAQHTTKPLARRTQRCACFEA